MDRTYYVTYLENSLASLQKSIAEFGSFPWGDSTASTFATQAEAIKKEIVDVMNSEDEGDYVSRFKSFMGSIGMTPPFQV